jgi:hypothetical protein
MSAPENRGMPVKTGERSLKWAKNSRNRVEILANPTIRKTMLY